MESTEQPLRCGPLEVELPNGFDGDALVHVRIPRSGRSFLFDAGDPARLAARDVLRLDQLFVSHCHVDHFIGFDALVRPRVCRPDRLTVHGPPGFVAKVASRLGGYDWNLTQGNSFVVTAREIGEDVIRAARFDSGRAFAREDLPEEPRGEIVHEDAELRVRAALLDHRIPSQAWSVTLRDRFHVRSEVLRERGLAPGPWLAELKARCAESTDGESAESASPEPVELPDGTRLPLARAAEELLRREPGERFAYVTDTVHGPRTIERVSRLAAGATVFACEAPFLDAQADRALASRHLTATQAGSLAAAAGVETLLLFHVSARYQGDWSQHLEEARRAAGPSCRVVAMAALGARPSDSPARS